MSERMSDGEFERIVAFVTKFYDQSEESHQIMTEARRAREAEIIERTTALNYKARADKAEADYENVKKQSARYAELLDKAEAERDAAFIRGASWAYEALTGALIVPASFEEQARAALASTKKGKP